MFLLLMCIVSLLPPLLLFFYIRGTLEQGSGEWKGLCGKALLSGVLSVFRVILYSGVLALLLGLSGIRKGYPVLGAALYNYFVLAGAEELAKFQVARKFTEKHAYPYSRVTLAAVMVIVGIGFGLAEAIPYAIGADAPTMIVRGITMGHAGYGFIQGCAYGKSKATGEKKYFIRGFLLALLIHGTYDFCLSEELAAVSENFAGISLALAFLDIVLAILAIRFFRRRRNDEEYTRALEAEAMEVTAEEGVEPEN